MAADFCFRIGVAALLAWLLNRVGWLAGTALGLGYAPIAPATVASLGAVLAYGLAPLPDGSAVGFWLLAGLSLPLGVWACGTLVTADDPDPSRAVWDEVAGMWLTCLLLPKTWPWLLAAFLLFRALDVLKPWPIRRLERLPGGWGIMADDAAAGLLGAALLNAIHRLAF